MTRINTNVSSLVAQNRLNRSNNDLQEALTRLSTGLRINGGKDDPAGLIASEALRSEITSFNKAISNTNRANQIITTADSALGQVSSLLSDIRGLVVEAANTGALSNDEIAANQLQVDSSLEAINRIAQTTTFQGRKLLDGGLDFLTKAGNNYDKIKDLKVDQANLGPTGKLSVNVSVTSAAEQAEVTIADIPEAVTAAASTGSISLSSNVTAASAAGSIEFTQVNEATQATSGTVSLPVAGDFTLTAKEGGAFAGAAGEGLDIIVATTAAGTGGDEGTLSTIDSSVAGQITITLEEGQTLAEIATFLGANADFEFASVAADIVTDASILATGTASLSGGADETTSTATINITADDDGVAGNVGLVFTKSTGATTGAAINGDGNIEVEVDDSGTTTLEAIRAAIAGIEGFSATLTNDDPITVGDYDNTAAAPTLDDLAGGIDAAESTATITLTATATGAAANDATITISAVNGTTTPTAVVDEDGNITVTINDDTDVDISAILGAINDEGTYSAEAGEDDTLTTFNAASDTSDTTAFADGVDASGGLSQNVVFELLGKSGSEVFNVSAGTNIDDLVQQINLVKDATGVVATKDGNSLVLTSSDYGSDAIVDVRIIEEAAGGTFKADIGAGIRDEGADIKAKVNGIDAKGRGNELSINTSTLDLSVVVEDGSSDSVSFDIIGGGALFQLGADVVSNQQARIGIGSVSAARLGGSSGKLFQLGSGEAAELSVDPNKAAKIVTEAINQVTSLRGRLGAFQSTTLESNLVSLNDTMANLQEAESSIRDADFAQESARLTRAQILVQSGTNVLSLANQNPQNVLSLLR